MIEYTIVMPHNIGNTSFIYIYIYNRLLHTDLYICLPQHTAFQANKM